MRRERPPAVLVMAILSTAFGILFLLCGGGSMASAIWTYANPAMGMTGVPQVVEIPGYVPFLFSTAAFDLVFSILLLISGIGLFFMKPFARRGAILFGVAAVLRQVGGMLIQTLYLNPALSRAMKEQLSAAPPGVSLLLNPLVFDAQALMYAFFPMAYAVALLIVMFLPGVRRAFAKPETATIEKEESAHA